MRSFDTWLSQFRDSISSYDYYIDFPKVVANAKTWKTELHMLNSLIGSSDIENDFRLLLAKYPQILHETRINRALSALFFLHFFVAKYPNSARIYAERKR